ncbi:hypothetical protein AVEN_76347-1 [Araneus ventricosus]|uniref:Uncharacterized protein n=1 Tax=Araneus ventricosus TaxID=182803 RepID=A0A4Y2QKI2_ARAVE|nr:hypothetical protein AVEN_76347-1 [Araneus ventricosus]
MDRLILIRGKKTRTSPETATHFPNLLVTPAGGPLAFNIRFRMYQAFSHVHYCTKYSELGISRPEDGTSPTAHHVPSQTGEPAA